MQHDRTRVRSLQRLLARDGYSLVGGLRDAFDDEEQTGAIGLRLRR